VREIISLLSCSLLLREHIPLEGIFESEVAREEFIAPDVWQKVVSEECRCEPAWTTVEVGLMITKRKITTEDILG